ncbi:hypothetical protein ACVWWI_006307 [Bradyrhizobium sp. USDA 3686]|nr:hypothetical protein [Bradyrhizobium canariense]
MELLSVPANEDGLSKVLGRATVARRPPFKGGDHKKYYCYDDGRLVPRRYAATLQHSLRFHSSH